jgi:hypothetical protein
MAARIDHVGCMDPPPDGETSWGRFVGDRARPTKFSGPPAAAQYDLRPPSRVYRPNLIGPPVDLIAVFVRCSGTLPIGLDSIRIRAAG